MLVMLLAHIAPLRAQDATKIEIVPMIGHSVAVFSVAFSSDRGPRTDQRGQDRQTVGH
jgi:hypothetical protein